jgi:cell division protein FtsB
MLALLRNVAIAAAVLTGVYYAYTVLAGPHGFAAINASHTEVLKMEEENERLRLEVERHREFIQRLKNDPDLQDRIIRQRLEVQKPGETTIYDTGELPQSPAAPKH